MNTSKLMRSMIAAEQLFDLIDQIQNKWLQENYVPDKMMEDFLKAWREYKNILAS